MVIERRSQVGSVTLDQVLQVGRLPVHGFQDHDL